MLLSIPRARIIRVLPLASLLGSVRSHLVPISRRSLHFSSHSKLPPHSTVTATFATTTIAAASMSTSDAASNSSLIWSRLTSIPNDYDKELPLVKQCKILSLSEPGDVNNEALKADLPENCEILHEGLDFDLDALRESGCNTVFCSHPQARDSLAQVLDGILTIEWVHTRSAGIDAYHSPSVAQWSGILTNAKGHFSNSLGEYTLAACSYFAKDFARLKASQAKAEWDRYPILELRGATLGIVGYGDIGQAAARLAKAYGMKVIALRRHPTPDPYCDEMVDSSKLNHVFENSDYVMCAAPLTEATRGMIGAEQFSVAKKGCVFVNVGRGAVVDENALVEALSNGQLKGAGLDVVTTEPLPKTSPLWKMDNVLLSPHNMDWTESFMRESTNFFVSEQLPRFVRDLPLYNKIDAAAGY